MSKVPISAKKDVPQKCSLCEKRFKNKEALVSHIGKVHKSTIPQGWTPSRYENYLRTGKSNGNCIVCKKETTWNESTWKYNRTCGSPKCKQALADKAKKNMIATHGVEHLMNDPDFQRKLVYSKRTSGEYRWSTDDNHKYQFMYASKVEKSFLEMLDLFLNFEPCDVFSPSPNTYTYKYNGEDHFYIPDVFISSLNLEVELKEPKNNQNMHPKIQAVDKVKEKLKDELMASIPDVNYIKINGSDYREFFSLLSYLKDKPDNRREMAKNFLSSVGESSGFDVLQELYMIDVTEAKNHNYLAKTADNIGILLDLAKPKYTYKRMIDTYKRSINNCTTKAEYEEIKTQLKKLKLQLEKQIESERGNSRMRAESEKTVKIIDDDLIPDIESKLLVVKEALSISANKNDIQYKPIFVLLSYTGSPFGRVIRLATGQEYTHASISTDTKLTSMATFGMDQNTHKLGFIPNENIKILGLPGTKCIYALYMYMAPLVDYNNAIAVIDKFRANADAFTYSFKGCVNLLFGKETHDEESMFCSQFVSQVLASANPNIIKKDPSLITPGDLANTRKMIKVSSGKLRDYNEKDIDNKVNKILRKKGFDNVTFTN